MSKSLIFDIETNGLVHEGLTQIHCGVLMDNKDSSDISLYRPSDVPEMVKELSEASLLIGHNIIKYDIMAIYDVTGIRVDHKGKVFDTLIASQLCWPEIGTLDAKCKWFPKYLIGRYSLEAWGFRLGFRKGDYGKQGPNVWEEFDEEMLKYCKQDTLVTFKLYHKILAHLKKDPSLIEALRTEHEIWPIIARQEYVGTPFDLSSAHSLFSDLSERLKVHEDTLRSLFPMRAKRKGKDVVPQRSQKRTVKDWEGKPTGIKEEVTKGAAYCPVKYEEFSPGCRDDVLYWLQGKYGWEPTVLTKTGQPSLAGEVLAYLPWDEAKAIAEYKFLEKILSFLKAKQKSGSGWLTLYNEKTGALHGSVQVNGAATGRMTHSKPNLANVPTIKKVEWNPLREKFGKLCRQLFRAKPGHKIVGGDADGLELRMLGGFMAPFDKGEYAGAVVAGDKAKGTDIHTLNQKAAGLSTRDNSKTFIYAFIYGGGDKKLGIIALEGKPAGSDKSLSKQGKELRENFLKKVPALKKLGDLTKEELRRSGGYIRGLDGRKTYTESYKSLNAKLQGAGAVVMKKASYLLDQKLRELGLSPFGLGGEDYEFILHVHDEFQIHCKEEHSEVVARWMPWAIREAGNYFDFPCELDGTAQIGNSWAETH